MNFFYWWSRSTTVKKIGAEKKLRIEVFFILILRISAKGEKKTSGKTELITVPLLNPQPN